MVGFQVRQPRMVGLAAESLRGTRRRVLRRRRPRSVRRGCADLTAHLQLDGKLNWQAPAGRWTVLRFGWTALAEPARMGSGGYEVDVLNIKSADLMMDSAAKRMRELSVAHAGGAPIIFHTDSWEIGAGRKGQQPTWTDDFREQLRMRGGYDLLPYLPVLARRVVDGRETTDRFLRDYRDTVADLLADYYGRLQQRVIRCMAASIPSPATAAILIPTWTACRSSAERIARWPSSGIRSANTDPNTCSPWISCARPPPGPGFTGTAMSRRKH